MEKKFILVVVPNARYEISFRALNQSLFRDHVVKVATPLSVLMGYRPDVIIIQEMAVDRSPDRASEKLRYDTWIQEVVYLRKTPWAVLVTIPS